MAFDSKFHCLAELEAWRAGFTGVKGAHELPNLVPIQAPSPTSHAAGFADERAVRAEMERRLAAGARRVRR